ncbi:efflux transporter outer membrane subunit [Desulfovibrio sp.]
MRMRILILAALAALLGGCMTMAPDYERPAAPVDTAWPEGAAAQGATLAQGSTAAADLDWKEFLQDPDTRTLVGIGLANNRDLRVAVLNIQKAQAQYRIQRADRLPTLNAEAGTTQQRFPDDLSSSGRATTSRQYSVGLGVSAFELDLFGRVKSLSDEALEKYLATEEARKSTHISLVAEISGDYAALVAERERLTLAKETLESRRQTHELTRRLFEFGAATELDLRQSETALESSRVQAAAATSRVALAENALRLALGHPLPSTLPPAANLDQVAEPRDIPAGLPSDLITRRPDILAAEHELKAANADIGAARANFFPRISLTGSFGTASHELNGLFGSGSQTWLFAPSLVLPLFDTGRNMATLEVSKVNREIAVAQYEKSIQSAFREVADALAQRATLDERLEAQKKVVAAARASLNLSEMRFRGGVDSFLPVLDAQRTLYQAQQDLIDLRLARMNNLFTLYKTLGGGWTPQPEPGAAETPAVPAAKTAG